MVYTYRNWRPRGEVVFHRDRWRPPARHGWWVSSVPIIQRSDSPMGPILSCYCCVRTFEPRSGSGRRRGCLRLTLPHRRLTPRPTNPAHRKRWPNEPPNGVRCPANWLQPRCPAGISAWSGCRRWRPDATACSLPHPPGWLASDRFWSAVGRHPESCFRRSNAEQFCPSGRILWHKEAVPGWSIDWLLLIDYSDCFNLIIFQTGGECANLSLDELADLVDIALLTTVH